MTCDSSGQIVYCHLNIRKRPYQYSVCIRFSVVLVTLLLLLLLLFDEAGIHLTVHEIGLTNGRQL